MDTNHVERSLGAIPMDRKKTGVFVDQTGRQTRRYHAELNVTCRLLGIDARVAKRRQRCAADGCDRVGVARVSDVLGTI